MSVIKVERLLPATTATENYELDRSANLLSPYNFALTWVYMVWTDVNQEWDYTIASATDGTVYIPETGTYSSGYFLTNKTGKYAGPCMWEVTCIWTYPTSPFGVPIYRISGAPWQQPASYDKDDKAITNSAGQPFDNPPTKTYYDEEVNVSFLLNPSGGLDVSTLRNYRGKVNSTTTTLAGVGNTAYAPRQLKVDSVDLDTLIVGGYAFWQVCIRFIARIDTYCEKLLDHGFATKDGSGNLIIIKDKNGEPLQQPSLLDGNGGKLASGATPHYITFKLESEIEFLPLINALNANVALPTYPPKGL